MLIFWRIICSSFGNSLRVGIEAPTCEAEVNSLEIAPKGNLFEHAIENIMALPCHTKCIAYNFIRRVIFEKISVLYSRNSNGGYLKKTAEENVFDWSL